MNNDNVRLLGRRFTCQCGKEHEVPTEELFYGDGAHQQLKKLIDEMTTEEQKILIVADNRTRVAAKTEIDAILEKGNASLYIVSDTNGDHPAADDLTKDIILKEAPSADLYIAVGSGVINDLVKWVSFLRDRPYVSVPTAASMNGYASANVAATVGGLKVLFHARPCKAVFVNPRILEGAPYELTASGLGDVLAKSVSSADWKLNQFLFDEYFCQFSVDLLKDLEPIYLENPEKIKRKNSDAIKALFDALFYSSIAMTITGTSSPASGGEHLISHALDMLANRDGKKHDLHGRQVGVASILMAALYEKIMSIETPIFHDVPESVDGEFWGSLAPIVENEYQKKKEKFQKGIEFLSNQQNWNKLKEKIRPGMVGPEKLKNCLERAEAAHRFFDIRDNGQPLDRKKFFRTVLNANQMRERFTVLDLALLLGILPGELDGLVDKWVG